jgi:hypothetical protein
MATFNNNFRNNRKLQTLSKKQINNQTTPNTHKLFHKISLPNSLNLMTKNFHKSPAIDSLSRKLIKYRNLNLR